MQLLLFLLLCVIILLSFLSFFLGLPGNIFLALTGLVYSLKDGWKVFRPWEIGLFFLLSILAEVLENLAFLGALRKSRDYKKVLLFSAAGGFFLGLLGSFLMPAAGTAAGSILGVFLGTALAEITSGRSVGEAGRTGRLF